MSELEAIITRIEQSDIGLEESLAQRRRGEALLQRCRAILESAEQELQKADVGAAPSPLDPATLKRSGGGG